MYNVEKRTECLAILFSDRAEKDSFIEKVQNYIKSPEWEDGFMTTRTLFNILGNYDENPYKGTSLTTWSKTEIENHLLYYVEDNAEFPYVVKIPHPHTHSLAMGIQKWEGDSDQNLEGIDDGGERIQYGENGAFREPSTGKGRYDLITPFAMERIAKWYELGALKYADRNWEKGIPFSRFYDSAMRHMTKYMMGMTDEDHLAAAVWNIMCIIHFEQVGRRDLDDLPHYIIPRGAVNPLADAEEMDDDHYQE